MLLALIKFPGLHCTPSPWDTSCCPAYQTNTCIKVSKKYFFLLTIVSKNRKRRERIARVLLNWQITFGWTHFYPPYFYDPIVKQMSLSSSKPAHLGYLEKINQMLIFIHPSFLTPLWRTRPDVKQMKHLHPKTVHLYCLNQTFLKGGRISLSTQLFWPFVSDTICCQTKDAMRTWYFLNVTKKN